jgi:hypothetical protein
LLAKLETKKFPNHSTTPYAALALD